MSKVIIKYKGQFVKYIGWVATVTPNFGIYSEDISEALVLDMKFLNDEPHKASKKTRYERIMEKYPEAEIFEVELKVVQSLTKDSFRISETSDNPSDDTISDNYICSVFDPINTVSDLRIGSWNMDVVSKDLNIGTIRYATQDEVRKAKVIGRI
jgi:hypothetical protein